MRFWLLVAGVVVAAVAAFFVVRYRSSDRDARAYADAPVCAAGVTAACRLVVSAEVVTKRIDRGYRSSRTYLVTLDLVDAPGERLARRRYVAVSGDLFDRLAEGTATEVELWSDQVSLIAAGGAMHATRQHPGQVKRSDRDAMIGGALGLAALVLLALAWRRRLQPSST
jgi:hypothetical protein